MAVFAAHAVKLAESVRMQTKVMVDSFLSFMDKVSLVCGGKPASQNDMGKLVKMELRFQGGLLKTSMVRTT